MNILRSKGYEIYDVHVNKISFHYPHLIQSDGIVKDGVHAMAYGHKDLNMQY